MAVYKQAKSKYWWYKFTWNGEPVRESTKQTNKRVAEQMEARAQNRMAKGEVGIRERKPAPTLTEFAEREFLPFVRSTFAAKAKTQKYYEYGVKSLLASSDSRTARSTRSRPKRLRFRRRSRGQGSRISSINRELQALRRMFHLAQEWGRSKKLAQGQDASRRTAQGTGADPRRRGPVLQSREIGEDGAAHRPSLALGRCDYPARTAACGPRSASGCARRT